MQVAQQLDWLTEEAVRSKLLPLLMQWDLCHPHEVRCSPLSPCKQGIDAFCSAVSINRWLTSLL